jgi:thymidine kinase
MSDILETEVVSVHELTLSSFREEYLSYEQSFYDLNIDATKLSNFIDSEWFKEIPVEAHEVYLDMLRNGLDQDKGEDVLRVMFEVSEPSDERIAQYTENHLAEYDEVGEEIISQFENNPGSGLLLDSCMNAGKSTLAETILRKMEKRGYTTYTIIAEIGDDKTTARCFGKDGTRDAIQVNDQNIMNTLAQIKTTLSENPKQVLYFDECTFSSSEVVTSVVDFCEENGVNYILAGLNKDSLGRDLPTMHFMNSQLKAKDKITRYHCKAFTMSQDDESIRPIKEGEGRVRPKGNGTHTARYVKFPDGTVIVDPGALQQIVNKNKDYVVYVPVPEEVHFSAFVTSRSQSNILKIVPVEYVVAKLKENPLLQNDPEFLELIELAKSQIGLEYKLHSGHTVKQQEAA